MGLNTKSKELVRNRMWSIILGLAFWTAEAITSPVMR